MPNLTDYRDVAIEAARTAGALLLDRQGRVAVRMKGPADFVTEADLASQEVIQQQILKAFPRHGFVAEENVSIASGEDDLRWIVDPLDGTTNFVHGIPAYVVSICLEQRGQVLVGVVFDPSRQECFSAVAGGGAELNGRPMRVRPVERLDEAVVAVSLPPKVRPDSLELAQVQEVALRSQSVRRMGASAMNLSYIAAGRFHAYWSERTRAWDIGAGILLVAEAGGVVSGRHGGPVPLDDAPHFIAAASGPLHAELRATLDSIRAPG